MWVRRGADVQPTISSLLANSLDCLNFSSLTKTNMPSLTPQGLCFYVIGESECGWLVLVIVLFFLARACREPEKRLVKCVYNLRALFCVHSTLPGLLSGDVSQLQLWVKIMVVLLPNLTFYLLSRLLFSVWWTGRLGFCYTVTSLFFVVFFFHSGLQYSLLLTVTSQVPHPYVM